MTFPSLRLTLYTASSKQIDYDPTAQQNKIFLYLVNASFTQYQLERALDFLPAGEAGTETRRQQGQHHQFHRSEALILVHSRPPDEIGQSPGNSCLTWECAKTG
jgi:hypothetical protein